MSREYASWIAGIGHTSPDGIDRADYCAELRGGDELVLKCEPYNRFNPKAVAVYHRRHHLGYIPTQHSWIAEAFAVGDRPKCQVEEVFLDEKKRAARVSIKISVVPQNKFAAEANKIDDKFGRSHEEPADLVEIAEQHAPASASFTPRRQLYRWLSIPIALATLACASVIILRGPQIAQFEPTLAAIAQNLRRFSDLILGQLR